MRDEKMSRKMTRGTTFILISRGTDGIISIIFSILIARLLTPDIYGLVGASLGIAGFINLFGTLGISFAVTKNVSSSLGVNDNERIRAVLSATLLLQLLLGAVSAIACFYMSDILANSVFHKPQLSILLKMLSIFVFTGAIVNWLLALFQGYYKMEFVAISDVIGISTRLGVAVSLVLLGYGAAGALLGFIAGSIVTAVIAIILLIYFIISRKSAKNLDSTPDRKLSDKSQVNQAQSLVKTEMRNALKYGIPMMCSAAIVLVYEIAGTLSLIRWRSVAEVSWFTVAFGLVAILMILPQSVNASLLPLVSGMHSRGDSTGISRVYSKSLKFLSLIINILIFSLIVFSAQIIYILFGNSYLPALSPFLILAVVGFIRPLSVISESVSAGMDRPGLNTIANAVTAILAVVLCIILVPRYGVMGAAFSILCSYLVGMGLLISLVLKLSNTSFPISSFSKSFIAGVFSAAIMFLILKFLLMLPLSGFVVLLMYVFVSFSVGFVIYLLLICQFGCFEKDDIRLISNLNLPFSGMISRVIEKFTTRLL